MVRKFSPVLFISALLIFAVNNLLTARTLKEIFEDEFQKFQPVATANKFNIGQLIFSETQPTHMAYNGNVVIRLSQIEHYVEDSNENFKATFAQLVIAHEMGHIFQVSQMKMDKIQTAKGEAVVFLECNADILAGIFMTQVFYQSELPKISGNADIVTYQNAKSKSVMSVYGKVLEMDVASNIKSTHPSNLQRELAIRQGILIGNIYASQMFLDPQNEGSRYLSQDDISQLKFLATDVANAMGYDAVKGIYIWAHEESVRIINENNSICNNLVIFNKKIKWNTSADDPTVEFSFHVLNKNTRTIRFTGRVSTEIVLRNDPSNIIYSGPSGGYVYDKMMSPNEDILISGKLNWIADEKYMPRIILPGEDKSLYYAFDYFNPQVDTSFGYAFDAQFADWVDKRENVIDYINLLMQKRTNFKSYCKGIGQSNAEEKSGIDDDYVFYNSPFFFSNDDKRKIYFDGSENSYTAECNVDYETDSLEAIKNFDNLSSAVIKSIPDLKSKVFHSKYYTRDIEYSNNVGKAVQIRLKYDKLEDEYTTTLEVYGH